MKKILLSENFNIEQKKLAIEMSLFMGFKSEYSEFPIFSFDEGVEVVSDISELERVFDIEENILPVDYISSTKSARLIEKFDNRIRKGLESVFQIGDFLLDENNDGLADKLNFKIKIPNDCSLELFAAACNFAFRFGMETTEYQGNIIADDCYNGNLISFEESDETGIEFLGKIDKKVLRIFGSKKEILDFSSDFCQTFPNENNGKAWIDIVENMRDSLGMINLDGQISYLLACENMFEGDIKAYFSPEVEKKINIKKRFPNVEFYNYKSKKMIYENNYEIPWEVDIFREILNDEVYPIINENDDIKILACLSEELEIRKELEKEIELFLQNRNILCDIDILSSYKQGFSWIEEMVLPKIKDDNIDSIEIEFKPFLPKGETEWIDEDGRVPSYSNIDGDSSLKWLDMPIRYLQELYPIDDIISREIAIDKENIKFKIYEGEEDLTYIFRAFNSDRNLIYEKDYKAYYTERPYIDSYLDMGKVHPSTGYIKVFKNGELVVEKNIKSDVENIWDIYQNKVLPKAKNFINKKIVDGNLNQPYFSQLKLEVFASEPNYRLGIREDMISSLDSLHEDMYFVGLDFFKKYGISEHNIEIDAPGLILPIIVGRNGKPNFKVTMYDQLKSMPSILFGNNIIQNREGKDEIELYIKRIKYEDGKSIFDLVTNVNDNFTKSYMCLLDEGLLEIEKDFSNIDRLNLTTDNKASFSVDIKHTDSYKKNLNIMNIDIMENELIGYDKYIEIIDQLKKVQGINVYKIAESYMGRSIYAIEIAPSQKGYISRTKRITNYPSLIINARHHANEVSSTNSAFMLLKKILTNDKYKRLGNKLNLLIIPMENTDGTEIHYELQKDNPNWKLHVARFNAVGKEFYYEHFKPNTIHTEAMALTRAWEKILPDVIVDNHGVPSHEWTQQFSGYTSPSYKGFWLPRSILYGYFWMIDDDEYKDNIILNKKIEDVVAKQIRKDEDITNLNKEWISIFEKYAHSWMPKLFPADYYKDMINYWIYFKFDKNHRYPSIKFPWITTVAYTSEVADETAQGNYLYNCAKAHLIHDEAIIDLLLNSTLVFESKLEIKDDNIYIKNMRHRPIINKK